MIYQPEGLMDSKVHIPFSLGRCRRKNRLWRRRNHLLESQRRRETWSALGVAL